MLFDATMQILDIQSVSEEDHVTFAVVVGTVLPGPGGQMMPLPLGVLKFPMTGSQAVERGNALIEAGQQTEDPKPKPDIVTAQNLQGVEQALKMDSQFRGRQ